MRAGYKETEIGVLPEDWLVVKLEDVCEITYGKDQTSVQDINGKYRIYGTGGFMGFANTFLYDKPSVLIGRKGTIDKPFYLDEPFWTVDTLFYTKVFNGIFPKWLYYFIACIPLKNYNEATGVPSLNRNSLNAIKLSLPSLLEQQKIAEILSTVDDKIAIIEEQVKETQQLKQGLMQTLLTKGIGHTTFKPSALGEIPESWEVKTIGDFVISFKGGASLTPSDFVENKGFSVIPKKAVTVGGKLKIDKIKPTYCSLQFASNNESSIVDNRYVITCLRDLVPSAPNIGYMVKFNQNEKFILAQGVYGLLLSESINQNYLLQCSNAKWFRQTMQKIKVGSTQVHIRNQDYFNVEIPYPPKDEQHKIASILSSVDEKLDVLQEKKMEYTELKKGLMQQLLTGKIRVNHLIT